MLKAREPEDLPAILAQAHQLQLPGTFFAALAGGEEHFKATAIDAIHAGQVDHEVDEAMRPDSLFHGPTDLLRFLAGKVARGGEQADIVEFFHLHIIPIGQATFLRPCMVRSFSW
jgi:hypothetical protein